MEKIIQGMTTKSLFDENKKIIIFDECETLTEKAQQSLRRPLEDYAHISFLHFYIQRHFKNN